MIAVEMTVETEQRIVVDELTELLTEPHLLVVDLLHVVHTQIVLH